MPKRIKSKTNTANSSLRIKAVLLSVIAAAVLLSSCSLFVTAPKITDDEAKAILEELVPKSLVLNEIFLGEGLPTEEVPDTGKYSFGAEYYPVSSEAEYQSIDEIKADAEQIYSSDYLRTLYQLAFDGVTSEAVATGDTQAGETEKVDPNAPINTDISPRYKMKDGKLYADVLYKGYNLTSNPDPSSAKIVKRKWETVVVEVSYTSNGTESGTMNISLVYENVGWRLDSPTY